MRLITARAALPRLRCPMVAIGTFDGVHRAHAAIVRRVMREARQHHSMGVMISFDPHPRHVLQPGHQPRLLTRIDQRLEQLRALGVDVVWLVRFTRRFAALSPEEFFTQLVVHALHAHTVVVGTSFGFGHGRTGDLSMLRRLGARHGVRILVVGDVRAGGQPINSSRIRTAIAAGRLSDARRWLGRAVALRGEVVHGAGRGHRLGTPTANLTYDHQLLPPTGVYVARVVIRGGWHPAVVNVGQRPTFGHSTAIVVEVHVLGWRRSLRQATLTVEWLRRLRAERRFPTAAALQRQVTRDIDAAQRYFRRRPRALTA